MLTKVELIAVNACVPYLDEDIMIAPVECDLRCVFRKTQCIRKMCVAGFNSALKVNSAPMFSKVNEKNNTLWTDMLMISIEVSLP